MVFGEYHGNFSKTFSDLFAKVCVLLLYGVTYNTEDMLPKFPKLAHLHYLRIKAHTYPVITMPSCISTCWSRSTSCSSLFHLVRAKNPRQNSSFLIKDNRFHSESMRLES